MSTTHSDETDVPQRFERHQMKRGTEFTDCTVAIPKVGRHPSATNPRVRQPRIKRQRTFEPPVGFFEPMQQYESTAAQCQRQGIVRGEIISLLGEPVGVLSIDVGSRAETVGRTLPSTPGCDRLRQSVGGSQLLRATEFFESRAALFRCDCEGKWQDT